MLKNYLTIALRNLMKHKLYSAINVFGLALGMASCILMILFVRDELSYDRHFERAEDIYRVQVSFNRPNGTKTPLAGSVIQPIQVLEREVPEVENTQYLFAWDSHISLDSRSGNYTVNYVAPDFFSMFDLPFSEGDPNEVLRKPSTAIVSAKLANSMYPDGDAVGRTFLVGKDTEVMITGILSADMPNTHFETDIFVSRETVGDDKACGGADNWNSCFAYTYVMLEKGASQKVIDDALPGITERYAPPIERLGKSWPGAEWFHLESMPLLDIHLKSKRSEELKPGGDLSLVYVFSFLSLLILVIACINFTNLATARASDRSKEISIRKIVGAERGQIILQILGESVLLSTLSLLLAISLIEVSMPFYNDIIGKELVFSYSSDMVLLSLLLLLSVGIGVFGGIYPAAFLSAFQPITLSKGIFANVDRHIMLRSTLVVAQFGISIALMSATFIVYAQMNFARSQALQFGQKSVLVIELPKSENHGKEREKMRSALEKIKGVHKIAGSNILPSMPMAAGVVQKQALHLSPEEAGVFKIVSVGSIDQHFLETYGVDLISGRNFHSEPGAYESDLFEEPTKSRPETSAKVIVNESALEYLDFADPESALGKVIDFGQKSSELVTHMEIIGVIPDVNFVDARQMVGPSVFYLAPRANMALYVSLDGQDTEKTIRAIKAMWKKTQPGKHIKMNFVDDIYDKLYAQEITRGKLFAGFSLLAMFIACLGLYGLASVAAERRTQEIGLRKVMGASVGDIIKLLVWQFSRPVLIANLVAWPVAFWVMQAWLSGFVFRIDLTPLPFFASTAITLVVAFATVTWHARKVAMAKPAETLRYE